MSNYKNKFIGGATVAAIQARSAAHRQTYRNKRTGEEEEVSAIATKSIGEGLYTFENYKRFRIGTSSSAEHNKNKENADDAQ